MASYGRLHKDAYYMKCKSCARVITNMHIIYFVDSVVGALLFVKIARKEPT